MKTTELMIGDWVRWTTEGTPVQVTDLTHISICFESMLGWYDCVADEFEPIPLTAEILEKNGFDYDTNRKAYTMGLVFQLKADRVGYYDLYISGCPRPISHVHTLQHALRLCGIEKEITL